MKKREDLYLKEEMHLKGKFRTEQLDRAGLFYNLLNPISILQQQFNNG